MYLFNPDWLPYAGEVLDFVFRPDPAHRDPAYRQLANHLAELISTQRLHSGERLPPSRKRRRPSASRARGRLEESPMILRRDAWFWSLLVLALLTAANAIWMLAEPQHWYHELPAAVPDTGAYNEHFVRDIGCAFATVAIALGWAAVRPYWRAPLLTVAAIFLSAHAGLHVFDTARGFLDDDHWLLDLPGVYLPALLTVTLALLALRAERLRVI